MNGIRPALGVHERKRGIHFLHFNFNNQQGIDLYTEHLNKVSDHLENGVLKE